MKYEQPELLQPNFDRFEQYGLDAAERIPYLNEVGMRQMVNGPIPITADGEPIIGLSPELDNFYLCCGFMGHGFMMAPIIGKYYAEWLAGGLRALHGTAMAWPTYWQTEVVRTSATTERASSLSV